MIYANNFRNDPKYLITNKQTGGKTIRNYLSVLQVYTRCRVEWFWIPIYKLSAWLFFHCRVFFFFPPPFFLSFFFFFLMRRVTSWNTRGANFARAEIARARENKTARARKLSQRENYGPRLPFVNDTAWNINLGLVDPIIFHWITWFFIRRIIEKKKEKKLCSIAC